jgi:DNA polymerase type B, organellar and viral
MKYNRNQSMCASTLDVPPLLRDNYDLFLAVDSEYVAAPLLVMPPYGLSSERPKTPPRDAQTNTLLSFQLLAVCTHSGLEYRALLDYRGLPRPSLGDLIRKAMTGLGIRERVLRRKTRQRLLRVMVAWHWGSAEMGVLDDALGAKGIMAHEQDIPDMSGPVFTLRPIEYHFNLRDGHDTQGRVILTLRDTRCLTEPDKAALENIGKSIGLPKIDIEAQGYTKSRIDVLMEENLPLFTRYAMRDVEIVTHWIMEQSRVQKELGMEDLAPTIGNAAAAGLKRFLGPMFESLFAVKFNKYAKEWRPVRIRAWDESFAVECFMGGMNQTYQLGHAYGTIMDIDISGAYAGAMGAIRAIDYEHSYQGGPRDPWDLTGPQDFALVLFRFPKGTQYPCLPVPTDHGLIFPLSCVFENYKEVVEAGRVVMRENVSNDYVGVTGPELHEALRMGADVRVIKHYKAVTGALLIAPYLQSLTHYRAECKKRGDKPGDQTAKLYINSLYGKFGQGLSTTYSYEEFQRSDEVTPEIAEHRIGRCCITEPRIAATITGIIRAVLNVLVREAAKLGTVLSATTDGLMLCLPHGTDTQHILDTLMERAATYPTVQLMLEGREAVGVTGPWLEDKHPGGTHAHTIKTRTNAIFNDAGDILIEPKVGFPKDPSRDDYIPYTQLIDVLEHGSQAYYTGSRLNTIYDVLEGRAQDVTSYAISKVVNVTPDWKRFFLEDGSSLPFGSMKGFWQCRRLVEDLGPNAYITTVQTRIKHRSPTNPRSTRDEIDKQILWRIAHKRPGYRLGSGITEKIACQRLGVNEKTFQRLRNEKAKYRDLEPHEDRYEAYWEKLCLW